MVKQNLVVGPSVVEAVSHASSDGRQPRLHVLLVGGLDDELVLAAAVRLQHERALVIRHLQGRRLTSLNLILNEFRT